MTVPVSDRLSPLYVGDGVQVRFDFTFNVFQQEDSTGITVRVKNGSEFEEIDPTKYTVTLNNDEEGGYITFISPPDITQFFYIMGSTAVDQLLDITNYNNFYPDALERALDKITAILQEWYSNLDQETLSRILADINYDNLAKQREADLKAYIDGIASAIFGRPVIGLPSVFVGTSIDDLPTQKLFNEKTVTTVESIADLANLEVWEGRTVYVKREGNFKYTQGNWFFDRDRIRCIATIAELRLTKPQYTNEIVFVVEYSEGSVVGGGHFRYAAEMSSTVFADDAVINIKNGSNIWTRCNSDGSIVREVPMEWGGVFSTYDYDQSDKVQNVINTCLTLATNRSAAVKSLARRVAIIPPPKLRCNKTIKINITFLKIIGKSSEWAFDANGNYDEHPTATALDGTKLKVCLAGVGFGLSNNDSVACYRDRVDLNEVSFYLATSYANDMPQVTQADTKIIGYAAYSNESTLRQAQVHYKDTSWIRFGIGFCNGNYSWGCEFDNCKWSENYYATWLIDGEDNGERMSFNFCIMQNNMHALWNRSWNGHITGFGGSYVWNKGEYFHLGTCFGATLRPNHVEYVTSESTLLSTSERNDTDFVRTRAITWSGGEPYQRFFCANPLCLDRRC
ncbi:hypothetical protein [Acinetobacter populi]|uniref:Uncharacterized protein n=1 Tax=Acinetobacter populi TaxID=1582270 RepID=A0A1Z9YZK6_9GAMM|nr:hypothetical protein [Acinetobacter populi]OUY07636.1 hypothetical protein CAP51_07780 [Acinetobacter populi]